jgi:hypothetical protein
MASLRKVNCVATWTALPSLAASEVSILNRTGADLEIRFKGETSAGQSIAIPDLGSVSLPVIANANEIEAQGTAGTSTIHLIITP